MIMRYESTDGFKKGDLWSNFFIMLMRDHYEVNCIMNRTDVWNQGTKEQWSIVISDIYYIVTKQWVLY